MKPVWDGSFWSTSIRVPCFRSLLRAADRLKLRVVFSPASSSETEPPSAAQLATAAHVVQRHAGLAGCLVRAIRKHYYVIRPRYLAAARKWGTEALALPLLPERLDDATFARAHHLQAVSSIRSFEAVWPT